MGHFQKTSIKKKEVIDNLKSGINTIREHILNLNSAIDKMKEQNEILENKVTVLEEHKLTSNLQPIPQHNFHMNEAFVKSINSLSELIHMLMKNIRNGLNNAKSSSETVKIDIINILLIINTQFRLWTTSCTQETQLTKSPILYLTLVV